MVLKFSRAVWFISILGVLASLLFVYASVQTEYVTITQGESDGVNISREAFFYTVLIFITVINSLVFVISALFKKDENFRSWFNGLIVTLNIFFVVALLFLNALNSNERFDFSRIGFLIYGSVILFSLWALSWPVASIIKKFLPKSTV